jgi:hypothetical protein
VRVRSRVGAPLGRRLGALAHRIAPQPTPRPRIQRLSVLCLTVRTHELFEQLGALIGREILELRYQGLLVHGSTITRLHDRCLPNGHEFRALRDPAQSAASLRIGLRAVGARGAQPTEVARFHLEFRTIGRGAEAGCPAVQRLQGVRRRSGKAAEGTANAKKRTGVSLSMKARWRRPYDRNCCTSVSRRDDRDSCLV